MYLLDGLEIPLDAFVAEVARATSDDEVAAFVRARADDEHVDRWREFILARRPFGGDRDAACKEYPWLSELPELPLTLDVLAEDDRRIFAAR